MAGAVVSDAGPLLALAKLNLLHLLKQLYGRVHFTTAVYRESLVEGTQRGYEDAHVLRLFLKQEAWEPTDIGSIPAELAALPLDRGERESIALALTLHSLLLVDEEMGREVARQRGLTVRGTLGVLVEAYRREMISADRLRLYFAQIEERIDIWISPTLCRRVLREVLGSPK